MIKTAKHIEIVRSTVMELSSMSQQSCDAIRSVLLRHYENVGVSVVNNLADLEAVVALQPDLVFLGMEFVPKHPSLGLADPDRVWLADYFDENGVAYTGSNQLAHELARDKSLAKQRMLDLGLNTSKFTVIKQGQAPASHDLSLTFPVFIKPTSRGGGLGIDSASVAYTFEQLVAKVSSIASLFQSDSLVEEYLPGREFSVAVLKEEASSDVDLLALELIAPSDDLGTRLLSAEVKSSNMEQVSRITDPIMKTKVIDLAAHVFQALGARDYARIDIRLDSSGVPHFLEANLMPSLISGYGSFPKACVLNIGLGYESMILRIVRLGLSRSTNLVDESASVANALSVAFKPIDKVFGSI
jgi:D-alanine-D-alanine ligase